MSDEIGDLRIRVKRLEAALRELLIRLDGLDELPSGIVNEATALLAGPCKSCGLEEPGGYHYSWCTRMGSL